MKESSRLILEEVCRHFVQDTSLVPVVSAELEFYIYGDASCDLLLRAIFERCDISSPVEKEKGTGQFEVQFHATSDPLLLADNICSTRQTIEELSEQYGLTCDFGAKPFAEQPGSGLHVHINMHGHDVGNVFEKNGGDESIWMQKAIFGLLTLMPASMRYFAPDDASYKRFQGGYDAPSNYSWGGNNRTVALRLPTSTADPEGRRIEHRVPASNSDPHLVLSCILLAIEYGFEQGSLPETPKIYGNANDEQYQLKPLPANYAEACRFSHPYLDRYMQLTAYPC